MNEGLVYSTAQGRMCPHCGQALAACACRQRAAAPAGDGVVRVGRQTRGRNGKAVSVISGLPLGAGELEALARRLKKRCGSGGTLREGTIEIQGEHRDTLVNELAALGFRVKRAGA